MTANYGMRTDAIRGLPGASHCVDCENISMPDVIGRTRYEHGHSTKHLVQSPILGTWLPTASRVPELRESEKIDLNEITDVGPLSVPITPSP
jgi:hypothetical protein